eukprot:m.1109804 g.1109804  ORF g.1109804 m.1109804 type:complete len:392 (-) comp24355_c0_seq3:3398-4573(-)
MCAERNRSNVPAPMKYHSIGEGSIDSMELVPEDSVSGDSFASCGISATDLAQHGQNIDTKYMILDVRPFGAFHRGHIQSALSVGCSAMLQRRLARGKSRVRDLIADDQRSRFDEMQRCSTVVVYDDRASSLTCVESNPLYIFQIALRREGVRVLYLEGGYQQFSAQFPAFCKNFKSSVQPALTLQLPMPTTRTLSESSLSSSATDVGKSHFIFGTPGPADFEYRKANLQEPPSLIVPYLLLGARKDAENFDFMRSAGVKAVLNVTQAPHVNELPGIRYKQVPVLDTWHQGIDRYFDESFAFIEQARSQNEVVLVHCSAGISRSATIVIAYLMQKNLWTLDNTHTFVRSIRPVISPNLDFMGHLLHFERSLLAPVNEADSNTGTTQSMCFDE